MDFLTTTRVGGRRANLRMDRFLADRYGYLSRNEWQEEILRGKISVNGMTERRRDRILREGDVIAYAGRDAPEPPVETGYRIVYEDEWLIVVDKPGNLPVHPAGVFYHNTLISLLQPCYPQGLHIINRLDRGTSGVMIIAKQAETAAQLRRELPSLKKTYIAIVRGRPGRTRFVVDAPLDREEKEGLAPRMVARREGRWKAVTEFTCLDAAGGLSLMKAVPLTGRRHQIRAHALYAGCPIVGDRLYEGEGAPRRDRLREDRRITSSEGQDARICLHSRSIRFTHPITARIMRVVSDLPADMRRVYEQGGGDG